LRSSRGAAKPSRGVRALTRRRRDRSTLLKVATSLSARPSLPSPRTRLLVVDDDEEVLAALLRELWALGYAADGTTDSKQALTLAAHGLYEVALVDLMMKVNGIELMAQLAQHSSTMSFILMTGAKDVRDQDLRSIGGRLTAVLMKPFKPSELASALEHAFQVARNGPSRSSFPGALVHVLLVEDSASDALLLTEALRAEGKYEVTHVVNLADAVRLLHHRQFDTVITDLTLPDALGLGAVIRLRECAPEATLLVCSATEDEKLALRVIELGAQDFIVKGASFETVGRALRFARVRRRAVQRLVHLAHSDALTGLANRTAFGDLLERSLLQAKRQGSRLGLMYIDLDGFKAVNDEHGHDAGDALLKEVATRIRGCLREYDLAARLGGDEFAALATDLTALELEGLAERIAREISAPVELESAVARVSASIGIAQFPEDAGAATRLLRLADEAMYAAKRAGKSRVMQSSERAR
jgi:two-component system, cell cycle response regulator